MRGPAPAPEGEGEGETAGRGAAGPSRDGDGDGPGRYLLKSEPNEFSVDDLRRDGVAPWDGVRNAQARNILRGGASPHYFHPAGVCP